MAKLTIRELQERACEIVAKHLEGIRYAELVRTIALENPETPKNTIATQVAELPTRCPDRVARPSRGLLVPRNVTTTQNEFPQPVQQTGTTPRLCEEDFYVPFADWLRNELDEATVAVPLGGAGLQKKWGTPDVVGVYRPLASHRIKFEPEIIAAEIKIDPQQPVVAFGQAAAYRLFAAKAYVVMPATISEEDYSRLESLCMLFGIGLVIFDLSPDAPDFRIRVRAQRFSPDMFYVNEFAERICQIDAATFNKLFG